LEPQSDKNINARSKRINKLKPHISLAEAREAVRIIDGIIEEAKSLVF